MTAFPSRAEGVTVVSSILLLGKCISFMAWNFMGKCKDCKLILYISFIVELVSLVVIYLSDSAHHISLLSIDLLVILSVISFAFSLIKFMRLKAYNFILQF